MEKMYLSPEEYEQAVEAYREKYGYDEKTDEEKAEFDRKLDQVVGVREGESSDETDETDGSDAESDMDRERASLRKQYGYDEMSDEEKQDFDAKLDSVYGSEEPAEQETLGDEDGPQKRLTR